MAAHSPIITLIKVEPNAWSARQESYRSNARVRAGRLGRSLGRFATTFAAGRLAIKYGILPWKRDDLLRAVLSCPLDQLRSAEQENDEYDPLETLRSKLVHCPSHVPSRSRS